MGRTHNVCRGRSQDVGRECPMALHRGQYGDVPRTLHWDVLRTSVRDVPWSYIEDHIGTSIGHLLGTSSGRNFAEWVKSSCRSS